MSATSRPTLSFLPTANGTSGGFQFRDLTPSTANIPDPNGRLDLERVRRISLGMNFAVDDNTLEVSDLYVDCRRKP